MPKKKRTVFEWEKLADEQLKEGEGLILVKIRKNGKLFKRKYMASENLSRDSAQRLYDKAITKFLNILYANENS